MLKFVFTLFNLQGTDALSATQEASGLYHAQNRLSRTFFKFFRTFLIGFSPLAAPAGNSVSLAQALPFVKNFFTNSFNFLHLLLPNRLSRTACIYYHAASLLSSTFSIFIADFLHLSDSASGPAFSVSSDVS